MLPLALHCVAAETTNTFYVAEGETKTVDEIVAANGFTFKSGDSGVYPFSDFCRLSPKKRQKNATSF